MNVFYVRQGGGGTRKYFKQKEIDKDSSFFLKEDYCFFLLAFFSSENLVSNGYVFSSLEN